MRGAVVAFGERYPRGEGAGSPKAGAGGLRVGGEREEGSGRWVTLDKGVRGAGGCNESRDGCNGEGVQQ